MRERINRLARGIVDDELPRLFISPESVEDTVDANTRYRREVYLASENNIYIKGLAYSDNARVKIINSSFGGIRNHITYELDTSWCDNGDEISGEISIVTNGGELAVPFIFHVETTASVRVLSSLNTIEDFAELAKNDTDMALRLMEYQDFTEAPFMKDIRVRTVYEGLKGHGSRQNALEEFFLALGAKDPIELTLSCSQRKYEKANEIINDRIIIKKNTWGYIYIEIKADGDFIELPKKVITQADFDDDRYELRFRIHPERMHNGKNLGAIKLLTVHGDTVVTIEAEGRRPSDTPKLTEGMSKSGIVRYMKLRLELERGTSNRTSVLDSIQHELEADRAAYGGSLLITLLQADNDLSSYLKDRAVRNLEEIKSSVNAVREDESTLYCYYQYLLYLADPSDLRKENVIRLIRKKLDDEPGNFYLHYLLLKTEPDIYGDESNLYETLREQYRNGCCSPFLYIAACKAVNDNPQLISQMDRFTVHVIYYGAKNGLVNEEAALRAAALAPAAKFFDRLFFKAMETLYEKYPCDEILTAVCGLLIKGNIRREDCFKWYELGIEKEISLTRLYEYYIYSLPKDFDKEMPKAVLLYFSIESSHLDRKSRASLYKNILTYQDPDSEIYRAYEHEMSEFAMDQIFESHIDTDLAVIYDHMIYKDVIDREAAKVIPAILNSKRITCAPEGMRYVVVSSEFLSGENAWPLTENVAYVPLYFDDSLIMFQDNYGNRYLDVPYESESILDKKDLEERCFEVYPEHPMLKMRECVDIMKKECIDNGDVAVLENALEELPIKPLYRKKMVTKIIDYYRDLVSGGEEIPEGSGEYLLAIDKRELAREERVSVCETLISFGYYNDAYEMIKRFGEEGINIARIGILCEKLILDSKFAEDDLLVHLSWEVFRTGKANDVLLDYLAENYNGTSTDMYDLLVTSINEHVETYDLEERLLGQLLFTGEEDHLDRVFEYYVTRKKTSDVVLRAYFTVKCTDYFLGDIVPSDRTFEWLEGAVDGSPELRKIPEIYILALAKHYSGESSLNEEQQDLCRKIVEFLLDRGYIFAWLKQLSGYVDLPREILDREILEYHSMSGARPILMVRILPDEEKFHEEEMRMVWRGIYIRSKVLFEGETFEYEIYEEDDSGRELKESGCIKAKEAGNKENGARISALNDMNFYLGMRDDKRLKEAMKEYAKADMTAETLFPTV